MDLVWQKLVNYGNFGKKAAEERHQRDITRAEGYFELVYKVLSWRDPALTLPTFLALNFAFWLAVQLQLRLIGLAFLLALAAFLADNYHSDADRPRSEDLAAFDAMEELRGDVFDFVHSLRALRKDSPSSFCIGTCMFFLLVSFVANNISGYVICYLGLLAMFFVPLLVAKLPPSYVIGIKDFVRAVGSDRGVLAEEDLIPFITDKDFSGRDGDLDSLLTTRTQESGNFSLLSEMPSHMDDMESLHEIDLLPTALPSYTPNDLSSDSDSDHKAINFDSRHFRGDSSSEEEFAKGLQFPTTDQFDTAGSFLTALTTSVAGRLYGASSAKKSNRKDSSSTDSEFEIINEDEFEQ